MDGRSLKKSKNLCLEGDSGGGGKRGMETASAV